jgi:hypothetical protein
MSEVKAQRIVKLEDGSEVNFGVRANLLTSVDEAANTVTFKSISGKIITWAVPYVDGLNGFVKTVYIYGLVTKVKSTLAGVKGEADMEAALEKVLTSLAMGTLVVRSAVAGTLTLEQKAYAIIKSTHTNRHFDLTKTHWSDLSAPATIAEVTTLWGSFDRSRKNAIRKDSYFKIELATLVAASESEVSDI